MAGGSRIRDIGVHRASVRLPAILLFGAAIALAGCVNTRVYSDQELAAASLSCGVAQGELVQEAEYPRILFLLAVAPTSSQLGCVRRWSRRRNMHLSRIDAIDWSQQ